MTRVDVSERSFLSSGVRCTADVHLPVGASGPVPVVVMAHGFGSVRKLSLPRYASAFAQAGYAVVLFDYRYFGDSDGEPRQLLDIPSQLEDWRAAIAFARSLPGVDADRVVAWGTSFAGGHVLTTAGRGEPLAAVIAQVPHLSGVAAVRSTGARAVMRLMPAAIADAAGALLGRAPRYVAAIGVPGDTAIMTAPGAEEDFLRMARESGLERGDYPEHVAARVALRVGLYSPIRTVESIGCPVLLQVATEDEITPARLARTAKRRIRDVRVISYPCGHFQPYVDPVFPDVIRDQLDFLTATVPVG